MSREHDEYWKIDQSIGEAHVGEGDHIIRLRVHTTKERYEDKQEFIPLTKPRGLRTYFHARPTFWCPRSN